jgi:hypothetical protein
MDFSTTMEIFVSNYTLVDNEIYELWVEGVSGTFMLWSLLSMKNWCIICFNYNIDDNIYKLLYFLAIEAVCQLKGKALLQQGSNVEMLQSEIEDHYRTYSLLDHQLEFQIQPEIMSMLIQRWK